MDNVKTVHPPQTKFAGGGGGGGCIMLRRRQLKKGRGVPCQERDGLPHNIGLAGVMT